MFLSSLISMIFHIFFLTYHVNLATKLCSDMVLIDKCTSLVVMPYSVYSVCLLHCAGWTRDLRIKDPCGYIPWFYTRFWLSAVLSNLFKPIYCNYVGFQGILVVFIYEDWLLFDFHLFFGAHCITKNWPNTSMQFHIVWNDESSTYTLTFCSQYIKRATIHAAISAIS